MNVWVVKRTTWCKDVREILAVTTEAVNSSVVKADARCKDLRDKETDRIIAIRDKLRAEGHSDYASVRSDRYTFSVEGPIEVDPDDLAKG